jgi:ribose 5-phosphate isomerase B
MRVAIGSDHAGFTLKEAIKADLVRQGHEVTDVGTTSTESVDYPDFAIPVAEKVVAGEADKGVVVCATGIGVSIAANKVDGARAAVVTSDEVAHFSREHNDANIIALGQKTVPGTEDALRWVRTFLETPFAGGRHERRVEKMHTYEVEHHHPEE